MQSRKNLRVIPRPVRRLVVGIRNTPAHRSRRTDCHSQCAHWLRNDRVFTRGAVCGGTHGSRPTAEHFVGQGPRALPGVREKSGWGRRERRPQRKCILGCVGEGLCPSRGRGRTPPLRSVARSAVGRADVGSELSAAGGRGSEVSEWPRSKF